MKPKWLACPEDLPEAAKAFWNSHAVALHAAECLTRHNTTEFSILCHLVAIITVASAEIHASGVVITTPSGAKKANPACGVLLSAQRQAAPLLQRFCL